MVLFLSWRQEMVRSCHQLMEVYLTADTCHTMSRKDQVAEPPSPDGVLDTSACVSCETPYENLLSGSAFGSGSSEAEQQNK